MAEFSYTEGQTVAINRQLLSAGASFDITGFTVTLILKDCHGQSVTTGTVAIVTAAQSKVKFTPAAATLVASKSPYTAHWKVVDGSALIGYWPQGEPEIWIVSAT